MQLPVMALQSLVFITSEILYKVEFLSIVTRKDLTKVKTVTGLYEANLRARYIGYFNIWPSKAVIVHGWGYSVARSGCTF